MSQIRNQSLSDLYDVTITSIADGEVPRWDGSGWINNTLVELGISETAHNHTIGGLSDTTITTIADGEVLRWDGAAWINNTLTELGVDPLGTDNSTDVTLAGTGTYISLVGQVITVDPITESDISDLTHVIAAVGDITDVTLTTIASGELLKWNGTGWINNTLAEAGISADSHNHTGTYLPIASNAVSATKLNTARTIDITGDIVATAVAFDGTANIAISAAVSNDSHTHGTQYLALGGGTVTGDIASSRIYPRTDSLYDLGSPSLAFRNLYVNSIYDEDGTQRIQTQGSPGTLFYSDTGVLAMSIAGGATGTVNMEDEMYVTAAMTGTGSTSYNALVHNASTYQVYRFTSKREFKENIRDIPVDYSTKLYELTPRLFDMKPEHWGEGGAEAENVDLPGFIADEVYDVFGEKAAPLDELGEPSAWSDKFMTVMLVAEVQKLNARLKEVEAKL